MTDREFITDHEFNTRWWGAPVGVVRSAAFFSRPPAERQALLAPWEWVELSSDPERIAGVWQSVNDSGFALADMQVRFRIGLNRVPDAPSLETLDAQFADEHPFEVSDLADFTHERFLRLPGATQDRVNQRFAMWSADLLAASPGLCIQVSHHGVPQGWFLSQPGSGEAGKDGRSINLTLAMLSTSATVSGLYIYQKALRAYAKRGHRLGWASFSVTNQPVHNIYAHLGAHFLAPAGNWLWYGPGQT
jgi:hypothetical protein